MPKELASRVELLMVHAVGCTTSFVQEAGLAALAMDDSYIRAIRAEYRRRRDFLVRALNSIDGVECRTPEGAFYVFAEVSAFGMTSREVASLVLEEGFVAILPGTSPPSLDDGSAKL